MSPKTVNIDGVTKQPATPQAPAVKNRNRSSLEAELQAKPPATAQRADVKSSKVNAGPVVTILITVILMVLLIGLAYFAYNKSK